MAIREATAADREAIVRMAGRFLATSSFGRLFTFKPEMIGELVDILLEDERGVIFVASTRFNIPDPTGAPADRYEGEDLVGFLAAHEATDPYSGLRYADEIAWFVRPEDRGGSYGPRLLASLERWARDKRLSFVKMVAPADGPTVAAFYQSIGYEALETAFVKRLE